MEHMPFADVADKDFKRETFLKAFVGIVLMVAVCFAVGALLAAIHLS